MFRLVEGMDNNLKVVLVTGDKLAFYNNLSRLTTHIKNSVKLKDHGVAQTSLMLLLRVKMKIRLKLAELFVVLSVQFPKNSQEPISLPPNYSMKTHTSSMLLLSVKM